MNQPESGDGGTMGVGFLLAILVACGGAGWVFYAARARPAAIVQAVPQRTMTIEPSAPPRRPPEAVPEPEPISDREQARASLAFAALLLDAYVPRTDGEHVLRTETLTDIARRQAALGDKAGGAKSLAAALAAYPQQLGESVKIPLAVGVVRAQLALGRADAAWGLVGEVAPDSLRDRMLAELIDALLDDDRTADTAPALLLVRDPETRCRSLLRVAARRAEAGPAGRAAAIELVRRAEKELGEADLPQAKVLQGDLLPSLAGVLLLLERFDEARQVVEPLTDGGLKADRCRMEALVRLEAGQPGPAVAASLQQAAAAIETIEPPSARILPWLDLAAAQTAAKQSPAAERSIETAERLLNELQPTDLGDENALAETAHIKAIGLAKAASRRRPLSSAAARATLKAALEQVDSIAGGRRRCEAYLDVAETQLEPLERPRNEADSVAALEALNAFRRATQQIDSPVEAAELWARALEPAFEVGHPDARRWFAAAVASAALVPVPAQRARLVRTLIAASAAHGETEDASRQARQTKGELPQALALVGLAEGIARRQRALTEKLLGQ